MFTSPKVQRHFRKRQNVDFLTEQFVEGVSCSGAVGLGGQQRVEGDSCKPLQVGGDPAEEDEQCECEAGSNHEYR